MILAQPAIRLLLYSPGVRTSTKVYSPLLRNSLKSFGLILRRRPSILFIKTLAAVAILSIGPLKGGAYAKSILLKSSNVAPKLMAAAKASTRLSTPPVPTT